MTILELVAIVRDKTGVSEPSITAIVRVAWPSHQHFTPTQAALVVRAIFGKIPPNENKTETLTDEQLWGSL